MTTKYRYISLMLKNSVRGYRDPDGSQILCRTYVRKALGLAAAGAVPLPSHIQFTVSNEPLANGVKAKIVKGSNLTLMNVSSEGREHYVYTKLAEHLHSLDLPRVRVFYLRIDRLSRAKYAAAI